MSAMTQSGMISSGMDPKRHGYRLAVVDSGFDARRARQGLVSEAELLRAAALALPHEAAPVV
jgi:hypothetical protein